jgi:hypothetical protein
MGMGIYQMHAQKCIMPGLVENPFRPGVKNLPATAIKTGEFWPGLLCGPIFPPNKIWVK